jgi:hypothetical protein
LEENLMPTKPPYRRHLNSSADLKTTYEATRAGFVALALEKNSRATPHIGEARALQAAASQAEKPVDLLKIKGIEPALLTAAGLSDQAAAYLQESDKVAAIGELIKEHLEKAGSKFVEELVFRFLLVRGDALGGSMRNVGGMLAQRKFTRAVIATFNIAGTRYQCQDAKQQWGKSVNDFKDESFIRGLHWQTDGKDRILLYNMTVPIVEKNVDLCLFDASPKNLEKHNSKSYLALGELKGGIDPAGADEHWKTAHTALSRIRESFAEAGRTPHTFFVGAAIEKKMAAEIWDELTKGILSNAANLNEDHQVASISRWLCNL